MAIIRVSRFRSLTLTTLMLLPVMVPSAAALDAEFGATFRGISAVTVGLVESDVTRSGYDDSGAEPFGPTNCFS
ncbi:hypothetical protein GCM10027020_31520 [Nocardioides salsibiostraticola]